MERDQSPIKLDREAIPLVEVPIQDPVPVVGLMADRLCPWHGLSRVLCLRNHIPTILVRVLN